MARPVSLVSTFFILLLLLVVTEVDPITVPQAKTCYVNIFRESSCFDGAACVKNCESRGYDGGRCQYRSFRGMKETCFCKLKDCNSD
ncbi:unnamed protein product [Lupinus luteus]|uniref:Knottin scorpion toxin-like domain-containing protein n=1 Tax=Lupinus luteus TaxID=3873 RepID=A0AAV1WUN0_LUPLU